MVQNSLIATNTNVNMNLELLKGQYHYLEVGNARHILRDNAIVGRTTETYIHLLRNVHA